LGTARFGDSAQGLYQSEVHVDIRALEALAVRAEVAGRDGILAPVAADSLPDQPPAGSRSAPNFTLTTTWSRGRPLSVSQQGSRVVGVVGHRIGDDRLGRAAESPLIVGHKIERLGGAANRTR